MPEVLATHATSCGLARIRVSGPTAAMVCDTLAERGMVRVDAEEPGFGEYTLHELGGAAIVAWREEREEPEPPRPLCKHTPPPRCLCKRSAPARATIRRPSQRTATRSPSARPHKPRAPRGLAWLDLVPREFGVADVVRVRPELSYWSASAQMLELRRAGLVAVAKRVSTPGGARPVVYAKVEELGRHDG